MIYFEILIFQVIIIGATNRIDSIDPALRRPGRFDREILFTLPSVEARRDILKIHTSKWSPPPNKEFLSNLATKTAGYCGADLKALCTESVLNSLQRRVEHFAFSLKPRFFR